MTLKNGANPTPPDPRPSTPQTLALELARHAVHEHLYTFAEVEPLLQKLLPRGSDAAHSPFALLCLLLDNADANAQTLAQRIHAGILKEALRAAQARRADPALPWHQVPALAHLPADLPIGWQYDDHVFAALRQAASLERDLAFLRAAAGDLAVPLHAVEGARTRQLEPVRRQASWWKLISPAQLWSGFAPPPETALPPAAAIDFPA
jgi:hypothetical protein